MGSTSALTAGHSSLEIRFSDRLFVEPSTCSERIWCQAGGLTRLGGTIFKWLTARYCWSGTHVNGRWVVHVLCGWCHTPRGALGGVAIPRGCTGGVAPPTVQRSRPDARVGAGGLGLSLCDFFRVEASTCVREFGEKTRKREAVEKGKYRQAQRTEKKTQS